jgi:hypothetical protein
MQQRPDVPTTLDAIARFLLSELHPTVADRGLQFRVLIAVNALAQCAGELRAAPARPMEELASLRALLGDFAARDPEDEAERAALVTALDRELSARLRDGRIEATAEGPVMEHLTASLRATLAASNPRFDLSDAIA